jgi:hypothetical protein
MSSMFEKIGCDSDRVTVGSDFFTDVSGTTIPLMLSTSDEENRVLAVAYGEGLSWGFVDFCLEKNTILPLIKTDAYFTEGFVTHEI